MSHCIMCGTQLLERMVSNRKVLLCSTCGTLLEEKGENKYRYVGTTLGNQQLRELLAIIDKEDLK